LENGGGSGDISLSGLLSKEAARSADNGLTVHDIAREIAIGGWPGLRGLPVDRALRAVRDYLEALARVMIVEDQPAWAPHLRSRYVLRSSPKRHFVDPSLAVAALRATPERLLADLNLLGHLFESLVVRDLRVYAQAADARVLQYRDSSGLEADAIVEAADGRWAVFEVKLGLGQIDEGAATLAKFVRRVDTRRCGPPAAIGVIVGSGYGYVRDDGIAVIPIGALGP
jgi:predicted AAA+ superfamily ATPase